VRRLSCPTGPCVTLSLSLIATATTDTDTLSLHDALPILIRLNAPPREDHGGPTATTPPRSDDRTPTTSRFRLSHRLRRGLRHGRDRKSTRLNSSHVKISYAVFCLKKKKNNRCSATSTERD